MIKINDFAAVRQKDDVWVLSYRGERFGRAEAREDAIKQMAVAQWSIWLQEVGGVC